MWPFSLPPERPVRELGAGSEHAPEARSAPPARGAARGGLLAVAAATISPRGSISTTARARGRPRPPVVAAPRPPGPSPPCRPMSRAGSTPGRPTGPRRASTPRGSGLTGRCSTRSRAPAHARGPRRGARPGPTNRTGTSSALRVLRGSHVLADVGGPHVLAPVRGSLRVSGSVVGSYVMSLMQDDLGYVKLVSRFIGAPVDPLQRRRVRDGDARSRSGRERRGGERRRPPTSRCRSRFARSPRGRLRASLFVPDAPLGALVCGGQARRLRRGRPPRRRAPASALDAPASALADIVRSVTGGHMVVIAGGRRVAGAGPARVPQSGSVGYEGRRWAVYSWQPLPNVRAFVLAGVGGP